MKRVLVLFLLMFKILLANELNFSAFYDENITNERIGSELDKILDYFKDNPSDINKEFGEFNERAIYHFIFNQKVLNEAKFDFDRIEKILKFQPDLNYDPFKFNSFKSTLLDTAFLLNLENKIDKDELLKLTKIFIKNGYNVNGGELLKNAYELGSFELFKILLENGAKNADRLLFSIAFDISKFTSENGFLIDIKTPANTKLKEFIDSKNFKNFFKDRLKFLSLALEKIPLKNFPDSDIEVFIKLNSYIDNAQAIELLLNHNLKEPNAYKFIEKYANEFKSEKILKLINQYK